MALEKVSTRVGALKSVSNPDQRELVLMLNSLVDALRVVTDKLDADATVTDTNYTALFDAAFTK